MAKSQIVKYQAQDLTIEIDRSKCLSCGLCPSLTPETFDLDKEMVSIVKNGAKGNEKKVLEAAESCATEAITVIKLGTKLYPK